MERRTLRFHDFDHMLADVDALLASGYRRAGNWSLAQIAGHLDTVITMSLDGFPTQMIWPVRLVARWFFLGSILRHEVIRRRLSAPAYLMPPNGEDDRIAVESLRSTIKRFTAHQGEYHPSPVFGKLTREQWREVHLWHCEHHLSFLQPGQ